MFSVGNVLVFVFLVLLLEDLVGTTSLKILVVMNFHEVILLLMCMFHYIV